MGKNKWFIGIVTLTLLLIMFSLFLSNQIHRKFPATQGGHPTPALTPGYQKLYGKGNSIIYTSPLRLTFSGSGYVKTTGKDTNTQVEYIVGIFMGWEKIPNSTDRYILVKEYNNDTVHKARTTWTSDISSSILLVKEDVSKIGISGLENGYLLRVGTIDNTKELYKDRIITVLLKIDRDTGSAVKDEAGIPLADAAVIR